MGLVTAICLLKRTRPPFLFAILQVLVHCRQKVLLTVFRIGNGALDEILFGADAHAPFASAFGRLPIAREPRSEISALRKSVLQRALLCRERAPLLPIMQTRAPASALGRVMGIFLTGSTLAAPVGLVVSGVLAEQVGISTWFVMCGALTVACCAAGLASKSIRSLDDSK